MSLYMYPPALDFEIVLEYLQSEIYHVTFDYQLPDPYDPTSEDDYDAVVWIEDNIVEKPTWLEIISNYQMAWIWALSQGKIPFDNDQFTDKRITSLVDFINDTLSDILDTKIEAADLVAALAGYVLKTTTVNGRPLTGNISITASDVGLGSVNNTADADKPISTAAGVALASKSDTSHTHSVAQITDFTSSVNSLIASVVNAAPASLDTLKELADALGDDPNFAATITAALANKVDKASGKGLSANDFTDTLKAKLDGLTGGMTKASGTITRSAATASGAQDITLSFVPSIIFFSAIDDADSSITSDGWDDGAVAQSTYTSSQNVLTTLLGGLTSAAITNKSHSNSINLVGGTSGHTAHISAPATNKFTLNWTKVGSGRNVTVKYLAIK